MLDFFGLFRPNVELNSGVLQKAKTIATENGPLYQRYVEKCSNLSWTNMSKIESSIEIFKNVNSHQQKIKILLFLLPIFWCLLFYVQSLLPGGIVGFEYYFVLLSATYLLKLYLDYDDHKTAIEYYTNFLNSELTDF